MNSIDNLGIVFLAFFHFGVSWREKLKWLHILQLFIECILCILQKVYINLYSISNMTSFSKIRPIPKYHFFHCGRKIYKVIVIFRSYRNENVKIC